jgi:hypothetical protein
MHHLACLLIGSGTEDFASAPSHTTGHTVFSIRRLKSCGFFRKISWSPSIRSSAMASFPAHALASTHRAPLSGLPGCTLGPSMASRGSDRCCRAPSFPDSSRLCQECHLKLGTDSFGPSLHRRSSASSLLWPLLTALALSGPSSPRVRCCIFSTAPPGST